MFQCVKFNFVSMDMNFNFCVDFNMLNKPSRNNHPKKPSKKTCFQTKKYLFSNLYRFAIQRMVDTTLENLFRIDQIWPIVAKHLSFVFSHENAVIREHGNCFVDHGADVIF